MPSQPEANRRSSQDYRARHQAAGLCLDCPRPVYRAQRCEYHYQRKTEDTARIRQERRGNGLCPYCGTPVFDEHICCINCREDHRYFSRGGPR
jgi:hypothetical protein